MLNHLDVKYEKVILCLKLGRITEPARVYLRLLKAIFEDPASNMILYISGCEDGTTVEKFIEENRMDGKDGDVKDLIDSLKKQAEKNEKKGIDLQNIITGTMQRHQNREFDDKKFLEDRKETLTKIMNAIDVDIGFAKLRSEDLWTAIREWFAWHFKNKFSFKQKFTSSKNIAAKLTQSEVLKVDYTYGMCMICSNDNNEGWALLEPCLHRCHINCFRKRQTNQCPICSFHIEDVHFLP